MVFVYVIAWFAVVFGINSTSNAEIIVQGVAEYDLLHYECYYYPKLIPTPVDATDGKR